MYNERHFYYGLYAMMLGKLSEKILKYHKIFNIGVVASFSYLPIYFFELSSTLANKTSGTGFLFFILAFSSCTQS